MQQSIRMLCLNFANRLLIYGFCRVPSTIPFNIRSKLLSYIVKKKKKKNILEIVHHINDELKK